MEIAKRLSVPSSTGSSFTQEIRDLLEARCRLAYGIGFMLSITSWMFYQFILDVKPRVVDTPLADWQAQIYALFAVAFGLALIPILSRRASITQLLLIDHIVMVFTVLLAAFAAAVFMPAVPPYGAIALILFVHAAFIPVQTKYQFGLAVWATLGYPIAMLAARAYLPGIVEFWAANGGSEAFRFTVLEGSFSLGMFGFVSVLITHSLYGMRKSLHDAKRMGNYIIQREDRKSVV